MAFRLLRMNGYDISSDALAQFGEINSFYNSVQGQVGDMNTILELHKASQIKILSTETALDKMHSWTSSSLKVALTQKPRHGLQVASKEVDYVLKFPFYANLEGLEHKRYIENFNAESIRIVKTSYKIDETDLFEIALGDFQIHQSMYQKELQLLEKWVEENRLDRLEFARQKQIYCYFSAAATLFSPEFSDARMSWAKNSVLTTIVDDFFDIGGSMEELESLVLLVEKWDGNYGKGFCSKQVEIIFSALYTTLNELGAKASAWQKYSITNNLVEIWLNLMKSMKKEAEWLGSRGVPMIEEYMENGYVSFALGPIILPSLYFVVPELPKDIIKHQECQNLFRLVSMCGRLLNDVQGFQSEGEGVLNRVSLRILHSGGSTSVEEAKQEIQKLIGSFRTELLRLVLLNDGSVVPRPCKELFWKMCRILHLFYMKNDGFTSPKEMVSAVNAVIHEPLRVQKSACP